MSRHMDALALANEARSNAAAVIREVRAGTLSAGDALEDGRALSLRVGRMLSAQHRWGWTRTNTLLQTLDIPCDLRVIELSDDQISSLRAAIERIER